MSPEYIYLILSIIMTIMTNVHSVITKIKNPEDYASVGGIIGIICQIVSMCCCFFIMSGISSNIPTLAWIILILMVLSAIAATIFMVLDIVNGKTYDKKTTTQEKVKK